MKEIGLYGLVSAPTGGGGGGGIDPNSHLHTNKAILDSINQESVNKWNKVCDKYVVVCIAGQSNAVGYDESPVDVKFTYKNINPERIKQLGFYGEDNLQIIDLGYCAQSMQDMTAHNRAGTETAGTKGIHLPLANLMLDYIPDDYGVLMLPISFGGTGFTSGTTGTYSEELMKPTDVGAGRGTTVQRWGVDTPYYKTLRDRIIHVLNLNESNLFAGIVWCQGENDKTNAEGHYTGFQAMTEALFRELNDAGLGGRTPKGLFDKDIWYNMETVSYWYSQNQCQQIWDNYKAWNEKTYVEIPRDTESNEINGTGQTTTNYPSHYGNNAYQKVIAPRVLQKMVDLNTFAKKVNVVEPIQEVETPSVGLNYPIATEGTRIATQVDITTKSSVVFTINENGDCIADQEMQGKFQLNSTEQPCVYFDDTFKIEWEVKRGLYWVIIEGDISDNYLILGLGGSTTGQLAKIENGGLIIVENASAHADKYYTFVSGDKVRIYRNADGSLSIYRTNSANGIMQKWFEYPNKNIYNKKAFGFACGIAGNEFNGNFEADKNILFNGMKIQKQELMPNNKVIDLQLEELQLLSECDELPTGGIAGQVLTKKSETEGDVEWKSVDTLHEITTMTPGTGTYFTDSGSKCCIKNGICYLSLRFKTVATVPQGTTEILLRKVPRFYTSEAGGVFRVITSYDMNYNVAIRRNLDSGRPLADRLSVVTSVEIPENTEFYDFISYPASLYEDMIAEA